MRELAAVQSLFGAALADPAVADHAAELFAGAPARVRGRLAIYRGNILGNTGKALGAAYPVIQELVGDEFFAGLARAYAQTHPSADGDLSEYGAGFASFLDAFPHVRDLPYLPDVARLEWLVHRAHYAADDPPLDIRRLETVTEGDYSRLLEQLHSAVGLLGSNYPVGRIWEVHDPDYAGKIAVDLDSGPQHVLVYRPRFRASVAVLNAGEAAFLAAVAERKPLHAALERALAADAGFDLGQSLQRWVVSNVIVDFSIDAASC